MTNGANVALGCLRVALGVLCPSGRLAIGSGKRLHMPMTAQVNLLMREFVHRQKRAKQNPDGIYEPISFYNGMDDAL